MSAKLQKDYKWLNEPPKWNVKEDDSLYVETGDKTDFWQGTWYNFHRHTGHVYGTDLEGDFVYQVRIESSFSELYDQAGLMILIDEKHWLKTGIEYNDGQPMISSVLTNEVSDWSTGIFPGNPRKFWLRLTKAGSVLCVKYSCDNETWSLLRLCPFPATHSCFVGLMCCTPERKGLKVTFSDIKISKPGKDILHSN